MAQPVDFNEKNSIAAVDTPVYRDGGQVIGCFAFTPAELVEIMETGRLWVSFPGTSYMAITVTGHYPFDKNVN